MRGVLFCKRVTKLSFASASAAACAAYRVPLFSSQADKRDLPGRERAVPLTVRRYRAKSCQRSDQQRWVRPHHQADGPARELVQWLISDNSSLGTALQLTAPLFL